MVVPAETAGGHGPGGVSEVAYPEPTCAIFRAEALQAAGGFDEAFRTTAVLANAARCLRRAGSRVVAAGDIVFNDGGGRGEKILHLGAPQTPPVEEAQERTAVEAVETGDGCRAAGDAMGAIDAYRRALAAKGDFVEAILVLADTLVDAGETTEASAVADRLLELDPESSGAHNFAGMVHHRGGDEEGGRQLFHRAIQLQPDLVEARVNLGVLEWEAGHQEAAITELRQAADLDPSNRDLVANLGLIYHQLGQPEEAIGLMSDYLKHHPEDDEIQVQLALRLAETGDQDGARQMAEDVLSRDAGHAAARALLDRLSTTPDAGDISGQAETPQ
ncbi:tetratricopeptide repeat protein [Candidatus Latescibacterota bacterium]